MRLQKQLWLAAQRLARILMADRIFGNILHRKMVCVEVLRKGLGDSWFYRHL